MALTLTALSCASASPETRSAAPPAAKAPAAPQKSTTPAPAAQPAASTEPASKSTLADGDLAAVLSPCGVHFVSKWRDVTSRAFLSSRNVKVLDPAKPNVLLIDDVLVQVTLTPAPQFGGEGLKGKALLDQHRTHEVKWASERNGWAEPQSKVFTSQPARPGSPLEAQVWGFIPPAPFKVLGADVVSISFASVAVGEAVLTVSALIRVPEDTDRALAVSQSLLRTVTLEAPAFNVADFARAVEAEAKEDPKCERKAARESGAR